MQSILYMWKNGESHIKSKKVIKMICYWIEICLSKIKFSDIEIRLIDGVSKKFSPSPTVEEKLVC